jgi:hypothetical protein
MLRGVGLLFLCFAACGGTAVIDAGSGGGGEGGGGEGGSAPDECDGQTCGAPCHIGDNPGPPTGVCTAEGQCAYDTTCPGPCGALPCGAPCVVCNDIDCLDGVCDADHTCVEELPACG